MGKLECYNSFLKRVFVYGICVSQNLTARNLYRRIVKKCVHMNDTEQQYFLTKTETRLKSVSQIIVVNEMTKIVNFHLFVQIDIDLSFFKQTKMKKPKI